MNDFLKLFLWVSCVTLINPAKSQGEREEKMMEGPDSGKTYQKFPQIFHIVDGETLFLDDNFCFKSILVKAYETNDTFDGEHSPSLRLDITWESDYNVTSLNVESDSLNDSFCDAKDRFSYHRKPIKKNAHTFPDIVNYGSRFIPIKLDCKYVIIPEVMHLCLPLELKYSTPVCLTQGICSCRNISLPGPILKVRHKTHGVTVHWEIEENSTANIDDIEKVCISLEVAQVSLPYSPEEVQPIEFTTDIWEDSLTRSGRHFFPLNATHSRSYMIKGIYENRFECSSNITQIRFQFPEISQGSNHILIYSIFYIVTIIILMLMILAYFRGKSGWLLCNKLLSTENRPTAIADKNKNVRVVERVPHLTSVNNPFYNSLLHDRDPYVIDYGDLVLKRKLDEGHFGVVYYAESLVDIKGIKEFAVKQPKVIALKGDLDDFMEEIKIFKTLGVHRHVVRMIGYCEAPQPLSIVMEYVPYNLLKYLESLRDEFEMRKMRKFTEKTNSRNSHEPLPPNYISQSDVEKTPLNGEKEKELECVLDNQELESFSLQIARGMAHLEEKNIVHRDVAARNILVDHTRTLKISDFGMSRSGIYVNRKNRKFPLRWMSPEAVSNGTFSNKSDVWSYGIVLWEIGTLGGVPYSHLQNDEVLSVIQKGGHPDQPETVTGPLYNLMLSCWSYRPEDRPTFGEIVKRIEMLRQKAYVDFASLREYYVFPPTDVHVGEE